ncbi:hypothetical protein BBP40_000341 [Aspergillus hancockii]|nr:hypothetical protein BBP40_000341 [Aspergillus hancockii]
MYNSKLLVVVGITGNQGSSVANSFLDYPGWQIRGITRNLTSPVAQAWISKGAEVVKADLDDIASLERAFHGATAIFAVTDFWTHFFNPENVAKAQKAGVSINEYACKRETAQGMNMALAANSPSVLSTLTHFVFSTLSDTKRWSHGKYTWNYHFDGKAAVVERIRDELPNLAAKLSTVQIGMYVTNWKMGIGCPKKQEDGSFLVSVPPGAEHPLPWVITQRDTGIFVKALLEQLPGKHVLGYSEMATWHEFWALWAEIQGVRVEIKEVGFDEYFAAFPEAARREMQDSLMYVTEFGYSGGDPEICTLRDLAPAAKVTSLREFIEAEDWSALYQ